MPAPQSFVLVQPPMTIGDLLFIVATLAAATTAIAQEGHPVNRIGEPLHVMTDSIIKTEENAARMRSGEVDPKFVPCGNVTSEPLTRQPGMVDVRCREASA